LNEYKRLGHTQPNLKMKKYLVAILFTVLLLPIAANAQNYRIMLVDHRGAAGKPDPTAKPIPFTITLKDTVLKSGADGIITISASVYERRKDCMVREFAFYNETDEQKYSEPRFTRTIRKLMDYCDEGVLVAEKKVAGE
jgi:hypothetical protein